jgi:hypothetical protein
MKAGRREEKINDLPAFLLSYGLSPGKCDHYRKPLQSSVALFENHVSTSVPSLENHV